MGIKRMREAVTGAGLKEPEFETDGFFRAVFIDLSKGVALIPPC